MACVRSGVLVVLLGLFAVPSGVVAQSSDVAPVGSYAPAGVYVPPGVYVPEAGAYTSAPPPRRSHPYLGLVIAGPIVLAVPWLLNGLGGLFAGTHPSFGWGGSPDEPSWGTFRWAGFLPLIGPWVQLASKPTSFDQDGWGLWLVANGLLQATGLALLIAGLVLQSEPDEGPAVAVLPSVGPDGASLLVTGRL